MLIKEYRVILPMTVEQYQVAQLWTVIESSKNETGGGEGVEILVNEPFDGTKHPPEAHLVAAGQTFAAGQFTHKIYHLANKVPAFIRAISPSGAMEIEEVAWNAYPYCRTVLKNPAYMKSDFHIKVETMHVQDKVDLENVHQLSPELLEQREVVVIDIANDALYAQSDYKSEWDPKIFQSKATGLGPLLGPKWWENTDMPIMCAYKLVTCEFKWFGLQTITERFIQNVERRIFLNFHRQLFCSIDSWHGLSMEDIRVLEERTKEELDKQLKEGTLRGTIAE
uniref:Phosphatidylinositol transfer protein alpha isoform n=1 Tax=Schistocephalus solidus TaxID=70667 RepID=A0A0X3NHZ5_SCHSO